MMRTKSPWALVFLLVTILAGAPAAVAASDAVVRSTGDLTGVVLSCPDESVVLSGSYSLVATERTKQIGPATWFSTGTLTFELAGVSALGQTSGTEYSVVGVTATGFSFVFGAGAAASTSRLALTWQLVPVDGGPPHSFHEVFVVISDANQQLVAFVYKTAGDCSA